MLSESGLQLHTMAPKLEHIGCLPEDWGHGSLHEATSLARRGPREMLMLAALTCNAVEQIC